MHTWPSEDSLLKIVPYLIRTEALFFVVKLVRTGRPTKEKMDNTEVKIKTETASAATELGCFTLHGEAAANWPCRTETGIFMEKDGSMRIVTAEQQIEISGERYAPVLYQNCMRPEEKTIIPLVVMISPDGKSALIQDINREVRWKSGQEAKLLPWKPAFGKKSCVQCTNCGRCSW